MKIGTDIISIARIDKSISKFGDKFKKRYLRDEEINIIKRSETYASFLCAKEAISKALGCGIGKDLEFTDIIIYKDKKGAPHFKLSPKAQIKFPINSSSLSISHDAGFVIAVVVLTLDKI
jgi:holo-[acyl-carrier protein] synthase